MTLKTVRKTTFILLLICTPLFLTSATSGKSESIRSHSHLASNSTEFKGVPSDLDTETLIFLNLDSADVAAERPQLRHERREWNFKKMHNLWVPRSNAQLEATAPSYPFTHIIGRRSQLETYKERGYKYLFDYAPFVQAQHGIRETNGSYTVKYPVYIQNLENGDTYILGYVADNYVYKYKGIIKKYLLKAVKSKYKSKLK